MASPPLKRRRTSTHRKVYYYLSETETIAIYGIDARHDLTMLHDAFVSDHADAELVGQSEDNPYFVTPYIAHFLSVADNPVIELVQIHDALGKATKRCRDPHLIKIIFELGASVNAKAAGYWTGRYDAIVDSICRTSRPFTNPLPQPETMIDIINLIKNCAPTLDPYFPETFRHMTPRGPRYCATDIFREIMTATGGRRRFLERLLVNGQMKRFPSSSLPAFSPQVAAYLKNYWLWKSSVLGTAYDIIEEEWDPDRAITDQLEFRYAYLYENTRNLFKPIDYTTASYIFHGDFDSVVDGWQGVVADPITGDLFDPRTSEGLWTPEYIKFVIRTAEPPLEETAVQFALRTIPSASMHDFTSPVFRVHPLVIRLLAKHVHDVPQEEYSVAFKLFQNLSRDDIQWANIEKLDPEIWDDKYLEGALSLQPVPEILRDPNRTEYCFDPRIRRLFKWSQVNYAVQISLCHVFDGLPLGRMFDRSLQSITDGKYRIYKANESKWEMLLEFRCGYLFNDKIQTILERLRKRKKKKKLKNTVVKSSK